MKVLVIGLGSMGRRRIRNLAALSVNDVAGLDLRIERVSAAVRDYRVQGFDSFELAVDEFQPDVLVISTSPAAHMDYAYASYHLGLPCFVEASVVDADRVASLATLTATQGPLIAPSCTMKFFAGPRAVIAAVRAGAIGRPLTVNYQTGQWLPDWHPWEDVSEYYVSVRETGGCRELIPFELTWLNELLGRPRPIACQKRHLSDLSADIDDSYFCHLDYPGNVVVTLNVEVLSRPVPTRELRMVGTQGILVWSQDEGAVRHCSIGMQDWRIEQLEQGAAESGYTNPEGPYIQEMAAFLEAVRHGEPSRFPNSLAEDHLALETLLELERLAGG